MEAYEIVEAAGCYNQLHDVAETLHGILYNYEQKRLPYPESADLTSKVVFILNSFL